MMMMMIKGEGKKKKHSSAQSFFLDISLIFAFLLNNE